MTAAFARRDHAVLAQPALRHARDTSGSVAEATKSKQQAISAVELDRSALILRPRTLPARYRFANPRTKNAFAWLKPK
jgi:hypothetical protein